MSSMGDTVRYRDLKPLGSGGMASVTLAEDTVLGRRVALKRVHGTSEPRGPLRLRREALVGASLNHPNLVSVYDVRIEDDGDVTIVMEYVAGNTLQELIRAGGPIPAPEALRILEGVARGLDAIHAQGIVHRDVKPANVLLGADGAVKLADLGIAAVAERTQITTAGKVVGTFSYMAPEQLEGRSSNQAMDIYALSAVAFEMLSGRKARPEPNPVALAHAIATRPPPDLRGCLPGAPAEAAVLLQRAMASEQTQRPRSAGDLVRRLRAALDPQLTQIVIAHPNLRPAPAPPPPTPKRRLTQPHIMASRAGGSREATAPVTPRPVAPGSVPVSRVPPPGRQRARREPAIADEPARRRRRPVAQFGPIAALLAAVVVVAGLVATLGSGSETPASRPRASAATGHHLLTHASRRSSRQSSSGRGAGATAAARPNASAATPASGTSTASLSGSTTTTSGAAGSASTASAASLQSNPAASSSAPSASSRTAADGTSPAPGDSLNATTPSGAVQSFYESAAHHDYAGAWQLADANLRTQLAGFASFQSQMSAVQSITFHQAQTLTGATASSATVTIQTTSVLGDRTQQCSGTARTVRSSGAIWLLDRISINCAGTG